MKHWVMEQRVDAGVRVLSVEEFHRTRSQRQPYYLKHKVIWQSEGQANFKRTSSLCDTEFMLYNYFKVLNTMTLLLIDGPRCFSCQNNNKKTLGAMYADDSNLHGRYACVYPAVLLKEILVIIRCYWSEMFRAQSSTIFMKQQGWSFTVAILSALLLLLLQSRLKIKIFYV
ncbi:hypothetical protein BDC45DRAFT_535462 [Circinella umbellata]|nr:hypothetical protein BDC45DRAFT_535462 [Circinella umbellata]